MDLEQHWEQIHTTNPADAVSWFQPRAKQSLDIIRSLCNDKSSTILDVGGGTSTLVDCLLAVGYSNLSILDISKSALKLAQSRLAARAENIRWIVDDVRNLSIEKNSIDVWHDRAVFHFLTEQSDRASYIHSVTNAVKPGGHVIIATFDTDGPTQCSGLPVRRYSEKGIHAEFGTAFEMLGHTKEVHTTPSGMLQNFVYCYCKKLPG